MCVLQLKEVNLTHVQRHRYKNIALNKHNIDLILQFFYMYECMEHLYFALWVKLTLYYKRDISFILSFPP